MQPRLTPVRDALRRLPDARALACGIAAHLLDPSRIQPANAVYVARNDAVTARHAVADPFETLTGSGNAPDGDPQTTGANGPNSHAVATPTGTHRHPLNPDVDDDPDPTPAADRPTERVGGRELVGNRLGADGCEARPFTNGNRSRREAPDILVPACTCLTDEESAGRALARPRRSREGLRADFEPIDEDRSTHCRRPSDRDGLPAPADRHANAWRHGRDAAGGG